MTPTTCVHSRLARQCTICERDREIAALITERDEARAELDEARADIERSHAAIRIQAAAVRTLDLKETP